MKTTANKDELQKQLQRNERREKQLMDNISNNTTSKKMVKNPDTGEESEITITAVHYKKRLRRVRRKIENLKRVLGQA